MDKKLVLALGVMTLMAGLEAGSCSSSSCEKTSAAVAVANDEAGFVAQLSPENAAIFNQMTTEQRDELVAAASKDELKPNEAVVQHRLAVVEDELKVSEVK